LCDFTIMLVSFIKESSCFKTVLNVMHSSG
jgi:hypothetical protein